MKVNIVEVGPRDGLQNEKKNLTVETRVQFIKKLAKSGLTNIEAGAFVSPKWVPQMKGSSEVIEKSFRLQKSGQISKRVRFSCLVPNKRGMDRALETPIREVAVFGACSEKFSKKNINCSISESFKRFEEVISMAKAKRIKVRGYLSTAFGCPYEGAVSEAKVIRYIEKLLSLGVYEVSVGDTIGVATPKQVSSLLNKTQKLGFNSKVAMHFHDTRGTALANVLQSLDFGISVFDSSLGGLGGCPYAKGASGNLATEDLIYMLHGMGYKTGVDLRQLVALKAWLEAKIGRKLPSRLGSAGLPMKGTLKSL